jgi:hypothetical protein
LIEDDIITSRPEYRARIIVECRIFNKMREKK